MHSLLHLLTSANGRFCCKSPKLPGANFSAVKKSDRRPPVDVASITLPIYKFPGTAPNGTNAVAVYDNFFRALATPARLSWRPAGMSWRTPDANAR
jgi:hypothetical protein